MSRSVGFITILLVAAPYLVAQSYQTDFAATKVDRGHSPASFHGGVNVDGAGGAVDISIPLGPGIGARGLHFTPVLRGRWSPQWSGGVQPMGVQPYIPAGTSTVIYDRNTTYYNQITGEKAGGFERTMFGGLVLTVDNGDFVNGNDLYYSPPKIQDETVARFALPDGRNESLHPATPDAGSIPSIAEVRNLLSAFGYDSNWNVAYDTHQVRFDPNYPGYTPGIVTPFVHFGTNGSLVVGIWDGGATLEGSLIGVHAGFVNNAPAAAYSGWSITNWTIVDPADEVLPPRILVIQGEVAYEYVFDSPYYSQALDVWGRSYKFASKPDWLHFLLGINYRMNRMLNRLGDVIQFPTSTNNDVTWVPGDGGSQASIQMGDSIRYFGGNEAFAFDLTTSTANGYPWLSHTYPEDPILQRNRLLGSVKNLGTGEIVKFNYIDLSAPSFGNSTATVQTGSVTTLGSVEYPGKTVNLAWDHQTYSHNAKWDVYFDHSMKADGNGYLSGFFPHWSGVVSTITEMDNATGSSRATSHARQIPQPDLMTQAPFWASTTFYDVMKHPDGSVTLTSYVEPDATEGHVLPASNEGKMRRMAYLKHQPREIREYAAPVEGQGPDYAMNDFLATKSTPTASLAHRITFYDRWDLHGIANLNASFSETAVPHPTRTRMWEKDKNAVTVKEVTGWDSNGRDYSTTTTWISMDTSGLTTTDYLAIAFNSPTGAPSDPASVVRKETELKTTGALKSKWFWGRTLSKTRRVDSDSTPGVAPGYTYPFSEPAEAKTYEDDLNQVTTLTKGPIGGYRASVAFTFGTTGAARAQLQSALLTGYGPGGPLANSGSVGANYLWDTATGFMSRITPAGVTWSRRETRDAFGLVQSQTDPNGKVTTYQWDAGGRLIRIQPPDGLQATVVTPDADNLGMTVVRGIEASRYRFNGFGELVLEQRSLDGGGTWSSYRLFGYEKSGRRTGVTVWQSGAGVEGDWTKPNLVQSATVQILVAPGYYTYDCLGGYDANGNCVGKVIKIWTPPEYSSQNLGAAYVGVGTTYDERGRVKREIQPTTPTLITEHTYSGLSHSVKVGSVTTMFTSDLAGRLNQVLDGLNQPTTYRYDPLGRVAQVVQQHAGNTQTRNWSYTPMGWLETLIQPESGTTKYSDFTVTGKPRVATYGYGTGSPRTVMTYLDFLDRPTSVVASFGPVNQTFVYDQGTAQNASNGKILRGTDGGVILDYTYGGLGGALSNLRTTIWSGGAIGAGESREFNQMFGYDSYGNRNGGNTGQNSWSLVYDAARQLPYSLTYGAQTVLSSTVYGTTSWTLDRLNFGNGTATSFTYDNDQRRLTSQTQWPVSGSAFAAWNYAYDERGNLLSELDTSSGQKDQFSYDELNRLMGVNAYAKVSGTWSQYSQTFRYDAFGNRVFANTGQVVPDGSGGTMLSYSSLPKQIQNADLTGRTSLAQRNQLPAITATGASTGVTYDDFGNLTTMWTMIGDPSSQVLMSYDALGRVMTLTRQDGTVERYAYTPHGLRTFVEEIWGGLLMKRRYNIYNDLRQLVSQHELVLE